MNKPGKPVILVTGATGFVGSYLLRYLVRNQAGRIRALRRDQSSIHLVGEVAGQVDWVNCDILDITGLEEAMKGVDYVYHCAAVVSYHPQEYDHMHLVNVEGTANVINAALAAGIQRLVHISSIAALGRPKDQFVLSESTQWQRSKYISPYALSKYLGEMEVWRGIAEGLNAAIINPSTVLGSGFWNQGTAVYFKKVWQGLPVYPQGATGFVDVRDVAKAAIQLMDSGIQGKRFIINTVNWPFEKVLQAIARELNKKQPGIRITPFLAGLIWRVEWLRNKITGSKPFLTRETAYQSVHNYAYDSSAWQKQFASPFIPLEKTIEETCRQLQIAADNGWTPAALPLK